MHGAGTAMEAIKNKGYLDLTCSGQQPLFDYQLTMLASQNFVVHKRPLKRANCVAVSPQKGLGFPYLFAFI